MNKNKNLVSLDKLKQIAIDKGINKYILEIGYSHKNYKKYYVITIDNKRVDFGDIRYNDYNTFDEKIKDEKRRLFRARFNKLFKKTNFNKPLYYSYQLLW